MDEVANRGPASNLVTIRVGSEPLHADGADKEMSEMSEGGISNGDFFAPSN